MKRLFLLLPLLFIAWTPPTGKVTLVWDYDVAELGTNLWFNLYSSTDIAAPLSTWPLLTNVVGTNTQVTFTITPGKRFFVLTASNWWGESDFSNVASTPALPRGTNNLRITRTN